MHKSKILLIIALIFSIVASASNPNPSPAINNVASDKINHHGKFTYKFSNSYRCHGNFTMVEDISSKTFLASGSGNISCNGNKWSNKINFKTTKHGVLIIDLPGYTKCYGKFKYLDKKSIQGKTECTNGTHGDFYAYWQPKKANNK